MESEAPAGRSRDRRDLFSGRGPLPVSPGDTLRVTIVDSVPELSLRREIYVYQGSALLLCFISDGGEVPYDRLSPASAFQIRQETAVSPARDASVTLTFASGPSITLRTGEPPTTMTGAASPFEFVLRSSAYRLGPPDPDDDGDPFHVVLMGYRKTPP